MARAADPDAIAHHPEKFGILIAAAGKTMVAAVETLTRLRQTRAAPEAAPSGAAEPPSFAETLEAIRRARQEHAG